MDTRVTAIYMGPHSGPYSGTKTDAEGHYCLKGLSLGEYVVSAEDEKKGYPQVAQGFFMRGSPESRVTLTAAAPEAHVDVRIPFKAGFLTLLLTDAETGNPLPSMNVSVAARSDPDHRWMHISTIADRNLLMPPNEDVYVNVTSPGYSMWPDDGSRGASLSFLPGERQTLRISLRKVNGR